MYQDLLRFSSEICRPSSNVDSFDSPETWMQPLASEPIRFGLLQQTDEV